MRPAINQDAIEIFDDDDPKVVYDGPDRRSARRDDAWCSGLRTALALWTAMTSSSSVRPGLVPVIRSCACRASCCRRKPWWSRRRHYNPAILVNARAWISVATSPSRALPGSVHANGDLTVDGVSPEVSVNAALPRATTTPNDHFEPGGTSGGGYGDVDVPDIRRIGLSRAWPTSFCRATARCRNGNGTACGASCRRLDTLTAAYGKLPAMPRLKVHFFAEGAVEISGKCTKRARQHQYRDVGESPPVPSGSRAARSSSPRAVDELQFVADGDFEMARAVDIDDPTQLEGQILVREQLRISGNPQFHGSHPRRRRR